MKSLYVYFSNFTAKYSSYRGSCKSNLWVTPILILWNIEFKILIKKPGDEAFCVSCKFVRCGWDQGFADFNRFSSIETLSCYSCLVLYLHGVCEIIQLIVKIIIQVIVKITFMINIITRRLWYRLLKSFCQVKFEKVWSFYWNILWVFSKLWQT